MNPWEKPEITHNVPTKWNWVVSHPNGFEMGKNVDIGAFTYIMARYRVFICKNVQIGSHCSIYTQSTIDNKKGVVVIGEGARIGTHSTIMPGVSIGAGLTIPAYTFVKESLLNEDDVYELTGYRRR